MKFKAYGICLYKKTKHDIKILLCKGFDSNKKWGFVKGTWEAWESNQDCAIREFYEETSIKIDKQYLQNFFYQENDYKDIGIFW